MEEAVPGAAGATSASEGPNIERLKMIQGIIERLAGESASAKRWSLAITAALFALASRVDNPVAVLGGTAFVLLIYGLVDAYYLGAERAYRDLYERAIGQPPDDWMLRAPRMDVPLRAAAAPAASLSARNAAGMPRKGQSWRRFLRTTCRGLGPTVLFFYGALLLPLLALILILGTGGMDLKAASS